MENNERKRELEIDLLPILKAIWSKMWAVILAGVIVAGLAFGATKLLIKPTYRCSFTAYINNQHDKEYLSYQDINAGKQLVATYVNVIRSNKILSAAAASVGQNISIGTLKKMVTASVQGETEVIAVFVEHQDPETAYILANAIANIAPAFMSDIVEGSSMKVIDLPEFSNTRYKPNYARYTLLGFALGALLIIVKVIIDTLRDDTVKSEQEIEERFSLPILGVIPDALQTSNNKGKDYYAYGYGSRKNARDNNKAGSSTEKSTSNSGQRQRGEK